MTLQTISRLSLAAGLCAVLSGCSMLYNGAITGPKKTSDRLAYERFLYEQRRQRKLNQMGNQPVTQTLRQVQPTRSTVAQFESDRYLAAQQLTDSPDSSARPQLTSRNSGTGVSVSPLGLYGQLPQVSDALPESPLDSPDNLRQITFASEGADFDPDIDPTGTLLAYASTQHRATADLYIKRISGTAVMQLTNDPANDVMPTFSPDGKRVAFASDRTGNWDIYMVDITGGQAVQLTNDLTHDLYPSFSPDGKQLVYCTHGAQSGQWELVVIDVENPAVKRFIGYGLFPDWSPQDNRILFQRARERGTRWFSIWTVELVNGEGVRPTEIAVSSNAATIAPTWSPDAKHIAFSTIVDPDGDTTTRPTQADIWIINSDGSGRSNLTNSKFANLHPVWASDNSIYFVSNRAKDGQENIWAIRPERAIRVTQPAGQPQQPAAMRQPPADTRRGLKALIEDPDAMVPTR